MSGTENLNLPIAELHYALTENAMRAELGIAAREHYAPRK